MSVEKIVPRHIAIIMDGNGRWAKERGLARSEGHRRGIRCIKDVIRAAKELNIKHLTIFAFSTENWNRPKREIDMLMRSLDMFLRNNLKDLQKNNIRLNIIGREKPLPEFLVRHLKDAVEATKNNSELVLNVALNYGSRVEIVDAVRKVVEEVKKETFSIEELNEENFPRFLYTHDMPDPDLLIRTSGEMRMSNFLLWQLSYAELYFTKKYWPDFTGDDLKKAVQEYQRRERRFGDVNKKVS